MHNWWLMGQQYWTAKWCEASRTSSSSNSSPDQVTRRFKLPCVPDHSSPCTIVCIQHPPVGSDSLIPSGVLLFHCLSNSTRQIYYKKYSCLRGMNKLRKGLDSKLTLSDISAQYFIDAQQVYWIQSGRIWQFTSTSSAQQRFFYHWGLVGDLLHLFRPWHLFWIISNGF